MNGCNSANFDLVYNGYPINITFAGIASAHLNCYTYIVYHPLSAEVITWGCSTGQLNAVKKARRAVNKL